MGARIAAQFANAGVPSYLFDIVPADADGPARNKIAGERHVDTARARELLQDDDSVLMDLPGPGHEIAVFDSAIVVTDLRKSYGAVNAVKGISFAVRAGTTTALLGGNGAGKTTTLSMLLGVLTPTAGAISVLGVDMLRDPYRVLARMNFTSPYVDLPKRLTVGENLRVFADLYGLRTPKARIAQLACEFDLAGLLTRPYGTLSAGQRTRVSLAKALLNRPEVLLPDSATTMKPRIGATTMKYGPSAEKALASDPAMPEKLKMYVPARVGMKSATY
jgi:ATPase subunit of ABC transporter with duplicated ATPase domains